jgi:hypothetical protein
MTSFLNMGGTLIDLNTEYEYREGISVSDQGFYSEVEQFLLSEASKKMGLDPSDVIEAGGRLRRAQRAIKVAMVLASADGPVPIGDMLAIGVLGVYAGYEVYKTVETFV